MISPLDFNTHGFQGMAQDPNGENRPFVIMLVGLAIITLLMLVVFGWTLFFDGRQR